MNYPHDLSRLSHYGLRGHAAHQRELRQRRTMSRVGWAFLLLLGIASLAQCQPVHAASNAPDVRGRFVLVVSATVTQKLPLTCGWNSTNLCDALAQQPLLAIAGFDSFYRCRGAGMEMQARFRSDGYVVDFACLLQGK